ncbi:hypothetical protein [Acidimangrovimonas sediminis]|uniref:hypothetical protein n=1 Tax=Acidimangrovimonas sediminis TaxID=2056283 RepID=UPI000C80306C|nr:hypothetical protein [Acidimangrovimonas sediminis]
MHAAALTSPRLQRVLAVLRDGKPHTTRDIVRRGRVMAVNVCISELRHHGAEIACIKQATAQGWRFYYTMTRAPKV